MDFDRVIDRRNTECIKWNWFDEDVLPMWVADMDFRSPEPVIEALRTRIEHGVFGYGWPPEDLKDAIQAHLLKRHAWKVAQEEIDFISGVVTGFNHAIYSLTEPGDKVLIQTPVYPPFLAAPEQAGRERVVNPLIRQPDGKYEIDFEDFEAKAASGVKLFILCSPHNPVGRVFTREELTRMAEICLAHDILICSDEIHADLVFSGAKHIPIASLSPEIAAKTVTYFAPSKTFNVAGLSTSVYVAQSEALRDKLQHSMTMLLGHPNILGTRAALAAYRDSQDWLDELLVYLEANRDYLVDYARSELPGISIWKPEGTFLAWLDCRELDLPVSPQQFFLENAKVGLNKGTDFGDKGEGFVRLNFGCPRTLLTEGLERMKKALANREK
ncbi:pyridoxal phosphate-dependent aminotransferase [Chloroflexota bacterium]|nr:pyridoxal phosphate-dependent aminotransferase [Chloroflexota bacterium]